MFADNFLVHLPREREGRGEMGEGKGRGREWEGKESEGYGLWRGGKWECTKKYPKTQHIWHLGTPLGATAPCHTFLESSFFLRAKFASHF